MKKVLTNLVQKTRITPLGFLLFILIFTAVHLVAFLTGDFALLRLFYPLLTVVLLVKILLDS